MKKTLLTVLFACLTVSVFADALPPLDDASLPYESDFQNAINNDWSDGMGWEDVWNSSSYLEEYRGGMDAQSIKDLFEIYAKKSGIGGVGTSPVGGLVIPLLLFMLGYILFVFFQHRKTTILLLLIMISFQMRANTCAEAIQLQPYQVQLVDYTIVGGGENWFKASADKLPTSILITAKQQPQVSKYTSCSASKTDVASMVRKVGENQYLLEIPSSYLNLEEECYFQITSPTSCPDLVELRSGYNEVLPNGAYAFTTTTYYLPIIMTIYPEMLGDAYEPVVTMNLSCDGNIEDPIVQSFYQMVQEKGASLGLDFSFPLDMNSQFMEKIKDELGRTIAYRFEFPEIFRTLLIMAGSTQYAPAYVNVTTGCTCRIVISSGVDTDCRENIPVLAMDSRIPINAAEASQVYLFPFGEWMEETYRITWNGTNSAEVRLSMDCEDGHENEVITLNPNGYYRILPAETKRWINAYGTEMYLSCVTEGTGYISIESERTGASVYQITDLVGANGERAVIDQDAKIITICFKDETVVGVILAAVKASKLTITENGNIKIDNKIINDAINDNNVEVNNNNGDITIKIKDTDVQYTVKATAAETDEMREINATIKSISINGNALEGFDPLKAGYVIYMSEQALTITAEKNDDVTTLLDEIEADEEIRAAYEPTIQVLLPSTNDWATYTVTGKAIDSNKQIYTLHFRLTPSSNADLETLFVKGENVELVPNQNEYHFAHQTFIPMVQATPSDANAHVNMQIATHLPGYTQIIVTAQDGVTQKVYTLYFETDPATYDLEAYGTVTIKAVPENVGGKVFAATSITSIDWESATGEQELNVTGTVTGSKTKPSEAPVHLYLSAHAENTTGYFFAGWNFDENNTSSYLSKEDLNAHFETVVRSINTEYPTQLPTYYAHFRHPNVVSVENVQYECNLNETVTGVITFVIEDMKSAGELNLSKEEQTGFTFDEAKLHENIYTLPFTYNATSAGAHTVSITLTPYDNPSGSKTGTITINVHETALPNFSVTAISKHNSIVLDWNSATVSNATKYIVMRDGLQIGEAITGKTITDANLALGVEYTYTVQALNSSSELLAFANIKAKTGRISAASASDFEVHLPYYARFVAGNQTIQHVDTTIQDVSYLFKDGVAMMDTLYFLVDNANEAQACCYVYEKDGDDYIFSRSFNPCQQNIEPINFNNKKIYVAGSCMKAYAGGVQSEGFFDFRGVAEKDAAGETVDIYLDNVTIQTAAKNAISKEFTYFTALAQSGVVYLTGGSSVFAFYSNTANEQYPMVANFHIRQRSELHGNSGCSFVLNGSHPLQSSPIASRPKSSNANCVLFSFDDLWVDGSTHTNGWLGLRSLANSPSIDLGNPKGKVLFNRGQYRLWGSGQVPAGGNETSYAATLAISYRLYDLMNMGMFRAAGFGSDCCDGLGVCIYDGTFTSYTEDEGSSAHNGVTAGVYRNSLDIRLPGNSYVNGGTFNENAAVYICSDQIINGEIVSGNRLTGEMPKNQNGETLCRFAVKPMVDGENAYRLNTNGTLNITLADFETFEGESAYDLTQITTYDAETTAPDGTKDYGVKGLNVGKNDSIYIYVNLSSVDSEKHPDCALTSYQNWAVAFPEIEMKGDGGSLFGSKGGDATLQGEGKKRKNAYFAYVELSDLTIEKGNMKFTDANKPTAELTNYGDAEVLHKVYMILPIQSNVDYQLIPPFDVNKMYILTPQGIGKQLGDAGYTEALAAKNYEVLLGAYNTMKNNTTNNFCDIVKNDFGVNSISQLVPYNPNVAEQDASHAHFLLYESKNNGRWVLDGQYGYNWSYVDIENNIIMKQPKWDDELSGADAFHVYFFKFPSGNSFWDEHYLILEGDGPQTLYGNNAHTTIQDGWFAWNGNDTEHNVGQLAGNFTFSKFSTKERYYLYDEGSKAFVSKDAGQVILPGRTYVALNQAPATTFIRSFDLGGNVTYEASAVDGTVLTTLRDYTLLVYGGQNEMSLQALQAQDIAIYDITGQLITTFSLGAGETCTLPIQTGMYLVTSNDQTQKVIVR